MSWTLEETPSGRVVTVTAERLDAAIALRFKSAMTELLDQPGEIVVDLGHVRFIDSAGLAALCAVAAGAGEREVCLVGVNARLARSLARAPVLGPLHRKPRTSGTPHHLNLEERHRIAPTRDPSLGKR